MKINRARFRNFAKFEDFECKFSDGITPLVGLNGAGKTTVGFKGLMACINGISERGGKGLIGERFRFIGKNGKSADVSYEFIDESNNGTFTINNHITEGSNKITIKCDGELQADETFLKDFLNTALMSAKNFCSLSGREQAIALGIDTSTFDKEIENHKSEFTILNRELKSFGELVQPEKVERIKIADLLFKKEEIRCDLNAKYLENKKANITLRTQYEKEKEAERQSIEAFNKEQVSKALVINEARDLLSRLKAFGYSSDDVDNWIYTLPLPQCQITESNLEEPNYIEELPDDSELIAIDKLISEASEINHKAEVYDQYISKLSEKQAKQNEIEQNKEKQAESIEARNRYISSFDFGFAGLNTDENGCLLLNGRPITESYFSRGELELIVAKLHASINPSFKVRFIDELNTIDEVNQEKILSSLLEAGFQVITAEVGKSSNKENCIVLSECKIASQEETKEILI